MRNMNKVKFPWAGLLVLLTAMGILCLSVVTDGIGPSFDALPALQGQDLLASSEPISPEKQKKDEEERQKRQAKERQRAQEQREKQLLQDVRQKLAKGQDEAAEADLQQLLKEFPGHKEGTRLLERLTKARAQTEKEKAEAEAKAREEKAKAEAKAKTEAESKAKAEAEAKAKAENDRAQAEARAKAKAEKERAQAEAKAKTEAESKAKAEAEAKAKAERDRAQAEAKAKAKAERDRAQAEAKVKTEAESKAKAEAEAKAKAERDRAQAEAKAKAKAERDRAQAEAKVKTEAEAKAKAEAEAKAKAERDRAQAEAKAKAEAEAKASADRERAEAEAKAKAKAEKERAQAEAKVKMEAEAKAKAEAEAKAKAEKERPQAEAKAKAEVEAKARADRERAEAEAKAEKERAQAEAKAKAEVEAKARAERERAEAEAKAKAKEEKERAQAEAKAKAEAEAKAKAERERAEAEAKAKSKEEKERAQAEAKAKAEKEKAEAKAKTEAEAKAKAEAEARARAEKERAEAEAKKAEEGEKALDSVLADARRLARQKKLDEAITLAEKVLAKNPNSKEAGECVKKWTLERDQARAQAQEASVKNQLQALEGESRQYLAGKNFNKARQAANKMLSLSPDNRVAQQLLGKIDEAEQAHQAGAAEQRISQALKDAEEHLRSGKFEEARQRLQDIVLPVDPDNPKAMKLMAAIEAGMAKEARRKEVEAALAEAAAADKSGDIDRSFEAHARAAEMVRDYQLEGQYRDVFMKTRELEQAIKDRDLQKAKAQQAAEEETARKVMALLQEGRWEEADDILKQSLNDPQFKSSERLRDMASDMPGLKEKADRSARARKASKSYESAMAMVRGGRLDEAEAALKRIAPGDSTEVAAKVERALTKEIPGLKRDQRKAAGMGEVARAEKRARSKASARRGSRPRRRRRRRWPGSSWRRNGFRKRKKC
ncbi:MAG: hypothetical protein HYU36_12960 [Planctomycetes bacterium]|nr:hypothetical protein [Planctomycetota bacterium]